MSWHEEKSTGDLVWDGAEQGIGVSPQKGIANIQNANISTETGEVMCSYARMQQTQTPIALNTGTLNVLNSSTLFTRAPLEVKAGTWITVGNGITGLTAGNYYVVSSLLVSSIYQLQVNSVFSTSDFISGFSSVIDTALFSTYINMGQPVQAAVEPYISELNVPQYRYYVLDNNSFVWVYDSDGAFFFGGNSAPPTWFLPYQHDFGGGNSGSITNASGIAVLNGNLMGFQGNTIYSKPTVTLNAAWGSFSAGGMMSSPISPNPHRAFVGHQGKLYYCDGQFIGSIFPNTSLLTGAANIQSYARYSVPGSADVGVATSIFSGTYPSTVTSSVRVPAVFFHETGGSNPSSLTLGTIYYIENTSLSGQTFLVFAAISGGSAISDITSGSSGKQYFNTFWPTSSGGEATFTFTPQRLNLPVFETAQCIAELGDLVVIGGRGNTLYPWNQVDPTPSDLIPLPENNTVNMITVNNMVYAFSGYKGNVYVTNGSTASLAVTVPDYCAGVPGTPASYIEPYFQWGGAMYLRGRVYFSLLDQTATKAGNCGGIWSFVPTQNFFIGQDTGLSLRQENQSSYGNYSGVALVFVPNQTQLANGPQYWSAWQNSYDIAHATINAIDGSGATPTTVAIIETDALETGTYLNKKTFTNVEYKVSTPLAAGESVSIRYRTNLTDAWASLGTLNTEVSQTISGYYGLTQLEKTQWVQFQITLTPTITNPTFVRLKELRLR